MDASPSNITVYSQSVKSLLVVLRPFSNLYQILCPILTDLTRATGTLIQVFPKKMYVPCGISVPERTLWRGGDLLWQGGVSGQDGINKAVFLGLLGIHEEITVTVTPDGFDILAGVFYEDFINHFADAYDFPRLDLNV